MQMTAFAKAHVLFLCHENLRHDGMYLCTNATRFFGVIRPLPEGCIRQRFQAPVSGSDLTLEIAMNVFAIAIRTLDPAFGFGDLKPDPRMSQCALAAITGHPVAVDDFGLWRVYGHVRWVLPVAASRVLEYLLYEPSTK
jgi:hypothetical protein